MPRTVRRSRLHRLVPTRNDAMRNLVDTATKVVDRDANILILGESGSGKDHLATSIHAASVRAPKPFVRIDCASIPPELFESELFGYERGAFTDAQTRKAGRLEMASGGTLYFDEITSLIPPLQAKLLRTIEEKQFTRLGGHDTIRFDARIISSSNRVIDEMLQDGSFRKDLYYRLNVVTLVLPPLRERADDIEGLAAAFLKDAATRLDRTFEGFDDEAAKMLRDYPWPGNLRELRNVVERAVILESGSRVSASSIASDRFDHPATIAESAERAMWTLEEMEERYIRAVLRQSGMSYSRAAETLGINRRTLLEKRRKYGIE